LTGAQGSGLLHNASANLTLRLLHMSCSMARFWRSSERRAKDVAASAT
jgi:hypothetical protein